MSGLLLFALGFFCGAGLVLALRRGGGRDLLGPPHITPRAPSISSASFPRVDATEAASDDQILDLIRRGRKIEAIKRMRELTDMRLAEAKDAVEAIERTLR